MYARKENQIVKIYRTLPKQFDGIVNFNNSSQETYNAKEFYDVEVSETSSTETLIPIEVSDLNLSKKMYVQRKRDKTIEEIEEEEIPKIQTSLKRILSETLKYAKAILMGKKITDDIAYFEDVYTAKYQACQGNTMDSLLTLELSKESIQGVTTLAEYKTYVMARYEAGKAVLDQVKAMIEVFRKAVLKDIAEENYTLANQRIQELDNLSEDITPQEFGAEFTRIISL